MAIITRFGNPVGNPIKDAGLHIKTPFIDEVHKLPKWILEWDGEVRQFPTIDKRMILVDATVRWRISDPLRFFQNLTNEDGALSKLDDILDASSREVVSKHKFEELTRDTPRINELDEKTKKLLIEQGYTEEDLKEFPRISVGRKDLNKEMKAYSSERLKEYGIEVIDFNVTKVNYIDENLKSVYESMAAERQKFAQKYRAEGENQREKILGDIDKESKIIMAEAIEQSLKIRGEADAEAARIYNESYNRSASSRDFYNFIKKMEMYKGVSSNTSLIISTESDFFDMMKRFR
jgi:membrane protease subunit HflC